MTSTTTRPYRIVIGVDFSEPPRLALIEAATLAQSRGGELHPVHVVDDAPDPLTGQSDLPALETRFRGASQRARQFIDAELPLLSKHLGPDLRSRVTFHVRAGAPAAQIVALAAGLDADLVVVATHGLRGIARFVMGSISEKVLRLAHCPVLVVRPKDHPQTAETQIEPPCPECARLRESTGDDMAWCERHRAPHPHAHRFSYVPAATMHGSWDLGE